MTTDVANQRSAWSHGPVATRAAARSANRLAGHFLRTACDDGAKQQQRSSPPQKSTSSIVCHVRNPASSHLRATDGRLTTRVSHSCSAIPSKLCRVHLLNAFVQLGFVAATCRHARSCREPELCGAINLILPRRRAPLTSHEQGQTISGFEKHCKNKTQTNAGIDIATSECLPHNKHIF